MKRRFVATLVVLLLLGSAAESFAFLRWLRELSGPGPWAGISFFVPRRLFFNENRLVFDKVHGEEERARIFQLYGISIPQSPASLDAITLDYRMALLETFKVDIASALEGLRNENDGNELILRLFSISRVLGVDLLEEEVQSECQKVVDDKFQHLKRKNPCTKDVTIVRLAERKDFVPLAGTVASDVYFREVIPELELRKTRELQRAIERAGGRGSLVLFGIKRPTPQFLDGRRDGGG